MRRSTARGVLRLYLDHLRIKLLVNDNSARSLSGTSSLQAQHAFAPTKVSPAGDGELEGHSQILHESNLGAAGYPQDNLNRRPGFPGPARQRSPEGLRQNSRAKANQSPGPVPFPGSETVRHGNQSQGRSRGRGRSRARLEQSEEGRFPTRSAGAGFGKVEQRPPGAREDHTAYLQEWTLRHILETHKSNLQRAAPLTWQAAYQKSLSTPASCTAPDNARTSAPAHGSVILDTPLEDNKGSFLSERPPTMHRVRSKVDPQVEFLSRELLEGHRWGNKGQEAPNSDEEEGELGLPDPSFSDGEALDEEASQKQEQPAANGLSHSSQAEHSIKLSAFDRQPGNSAVVHRLCRASSVAEMLRRFEEALEAGHKPNTLYIYLMARRLASEGQVAGIWDLLKRAKELGLQPTVSIFRLLAKACGNKSSFFGLREVLPAHLEAGLPLGRGILNSIISACGKTRRVEYAWDMVHLMEAAGIQPDIHTLNALLNMYAEAGQPENAEDIFGKLQSYGLKPNSISWATLAKAWAKAGDIARTEAVIEATKRAGIEPPMASWAALVNALALHSRAHEVQRIIDTLKGLLSPEQIRTKFMEGMYASLIASYAKNGDLDGAERALRDAELNLGWATTSMYSAVMWGFKEAADYESCLRLAKEGAAKGVRIGRSGEQLLIEAVMEAWEQQGRPPELLKVGVERFEAALQQHWLVYQPFNSRAPQHTQLDLHTFGPWSAQLMLVDFLRATAKRLDDGWQLPCDLTVITGRGNHSPRGSRPAIVRDAALRFLQSMFSPQLAQKNDGIVVIKRWELLAFMKAVKRKGSTLDAYTFQDCLVQRSGGAVFGK